MTSFFDTMKPRYALHRGKVFHLMQFIHCIVHEAREAPTPCHCLREDVSSSRKLSRSNFWPVLDLVRHFGFSFMDCNQEVEKSIVVVKGEKKARLFAGYLQKYKKIEESIEAQTAEWYLESRARLRTHTPISSQARQQRVQLTFVVFDILALSLVNIMISVPKSPI